MLQVDGKYYLMDKELLIQNLKISIKKGAEAP